MQKIRTQKIFIQLLHENPTIRNKKKQNFFTVSRCVMISLEDQYVGLLCEMTIVTIVNNPIFR